MKTPMRPSFSLTVLATFATVLLQGCGQGSEPIAALGQATVTPSLTLPVESAGLFNLLGNYSLGQGRDGFDFYFTSGYLTTARPIFAPASGVITNIVNQPGASSVTIYHTAHLSTRVSSFYALGSVRVGDYITQGSTIGNAVVGATNNPIVAHLTVYLDGNPVCPYSFLDSASRIKLNQTYFQTQLPCAD